MTMFSRRLLYSLLATVALAFPAAAQTGDAALDFEPGMSIGRNDAPITIVEYASPTCSHCKHFHDDVVPTIKNYVEDGKVRFVIREYLRNEVDLVISAMARCTTHDRYFDLIGAAFDDQGAIIAAANAGKVRSALLDLGKPFGIGTDDEMAACVNDTGTRLSLAEIQKTAEQAGVRATPTIVVNGRMMSGDPVMATGEAFAAFLDAEIAAIGAPTP